MAKEKNVTVLNDVLVSLATEAAGEVKGVSLLNSKRNKGAVSVYVLENEKVAVDCFVNIDIGCSVPVQVALLQEKIKMQIERATKFAVQSVNVQVVNVNIPQ